MQKEKNSSNRKKGDARYRNMLDYGLCNVGTVEKVLK